MTRRAPAKAPATVGTGVGPSGASAGVPEAPALTSWTFVVRGPPQPKERARRGNHGRWYTPERTRAYEAAIRNMAMLSRSPRWAVDRQYAVTVTAYFADGRPRDVDNVLKSVLDGLTGVAFANDRQVVETHAYRGGVDRDDPRTIVSTSTVEPPPPVLPKGRAKR